MEFSIEGLDDAIRKISDIDKRAKALDGKHSVSFDELFHQSFMKSNTDFNSIDHMLQESGFEVESIENFEKIPNNEWDKFISSSTKFSSWEEMMDKAVGEWTRNKLGLT